jgi:E3 ubiquitin-protein ligase UBR1
MPPDHVRQLLLFSRDELQMRTNSAAIPSHQSEDYMLAVFDFPLRVCAWLAQMRAGIWVRNGITLRHQMNQYRSVSQRDVCHQRDLFLLQAALVLCNPSVFLASMIDRYGLNGWMSGKYEASEHGFEDTQAIDVVEDFVHLLIILISDRTCLIPAEDNNESHLAAMRRDIAHVLCFKPLSFSDMTARLSDRIQNMDEFPDVLHEMTRFRAPEGLSDSGTFELKEQYLDLVDPYVHQYNRNQREEAETIYKNYKAKKTGKQASDIVFEPTPRPITSGLFQDIAGFTRTPLFTQVVYYLLAYGLRATTATPNIPATRVETYIQFVLQLLLVTILEDKSEQQDWSEETPDSFVASILTKSANVGIPERPTILSLLLALQEKEEYKGCESKIGLILHRLKQRQQHKFIVAAAALNVPTDRMDTASPASFGLEEKELKKKQALERQAKVMAAFKEQQGKFMANQDFDWGEDDFSDLEDEDGGLVEKEKTFKYPSGTCILCQEETNDQKLYGTFGYVSESRILRQTDLQDDDWVDEVTQTPPSLDRSADDIRPFGVSGKNRHTVEKVSSTGERVATERQTLGKGFPRAHVKPGPVSTGCGHIMHYACFEVYLQATQRRHVGQIARNHPERPEFKEFMCPLCKALGNMFLPIIWKPKKILHPGALETTASFDDWLETHVATMHKTFEDDRGKAAAAELGGDRKKLYEYGQHDFIQTIATHLPDLVRSPVFPPPAQVAPPLQTHRFQIPAFMGGTAREPEPEPLPPVTPMTELFRVYQRLRDTFRSNDIPSAFAHPSIPGAEIEDLTHTDSLSQALGHSISAVEVAQRGVQSDFVRATLIDKISPQTLTHLQILSETVSSYVAVGSLGNPGSSLTEIEYLRTQYEQIRQLFVGHPGIFNPEVLPLDLKNVTPLLCQDPFVFLTQCSAGIVPATDLDIHHVLRLCYSAEMVRVVLAYTKTTEGHQNAPHFKQPERFINSEKVSNGFFSPEQLNNLLFFTCAVFNVASMEDSPASLDIDNMPIPDQFKDPKFLYFIYTMLSSYALPFLRKAAILMHVRYGIELPHIALDRADEPELSRLSTLLKLPSLHEIFSSFANRSASGHITRSIVGGWVRHLLWAQAGNQPLRPTISLSHPAIFELVGLPKTYDTLTDEAIRRRCPTTGKELTDPALCLFCGEIMCSQAVCCMSTKGQRGGCNQHLAK